MATLTADPYVRIYNRIADHGEICSGGFDPKNDPDDRRKLVLAVIAGTLFIILFTLFSSCTRKVYIPLERKTTEYVTLRDTVIELTLKEVHDTTTITLHGNDTTSYIDNGYNFSYASIVGGKLGHSLGTLPGAKIKDSIKVVHVHTIDSIPYPVEVEKKLTLWQKSKIEYGGFAMGMTAALMFVLALFIYSQRFNRD